MKTQDRKRLRLTFLLGLGVLVAVLAYMNLCQSQVTIIPHDYTLDQVVLIHLTAAWEFWGTTALLTSILYALIWRIKIKSQNDSDDAAFRTRVFLTLLLSLTVFIVSWGYHWHNRQVREQAYEAKKEQIRQENPDFVDLAELVGRPDYSRVENWIITHNLRAHQVITRHLVAFRYYWLSVAFASSLVYMLLWWPAARSASHPSRQVTDSTD